jgi:electron transfer flavoprotein alpha subunit
MKVLILAEHNGNELSHTVYQSVTAALFWDTPIEILVIGNNIDAVAEQAASIIGVSRVVKADARYLAHQLAEDVADILANIGQEYRAILSADSPYSRNILPRAAALLDVEMISDVLEIKSDNTYLRSIYTGSINATVQSDDAIQILTVHSSNYIAASKKHNPVEIAKTPTQAKPSHCHWVSESQAESSGPTLSAAKVVVSGGGSLGSVDGFNNLLTPLANKLGAALGATRAAIEAGFAPNYFLVGQSGVVVAPDLYLAVGISGAVQHINGIKDSKVIVAINQDPNAPIFKVADYWLVGDLFKVVPELTASIQ